MLNLKSLNYVKKELTLKRDLSYGKSKLDVKKIQEWLNLHGMEVTIDGKFGQNTQQAVYTFQNSSGIEQSGLIDTNTFTRLTMPMHRAIETNDLKSISPNQTILTHAIQHLKEFPREVGGQNRGPWVRLYMKGNEGRDWSWCAGFVSFIIMQSYNALGIESPIDYCFSCDNLAIQAKTKGIFVDESQISKDIIEPGMIFLRRKTNKGWVHTGIIKAIEENYLHTIEGNTNKTGRYNGDRVLEKRRFLKNNDYINFNLAPL